MNDNILVPVDGSESAFKALDFAVDLSEKYGSKLWLLNVVQSRDIPEGLRHWAEVEHVTSPPEWLLEQAVAERVLVVAEDRAKDKGARDLERVVEKGDPAGTILEVAGRHQVDLIVMGTRGLSDLQGLVMGSVAHKVCHGAACTVVAVK